MKESTDLWFIAYIISKGQSVEKYEILPVKKIKCYFKIDNEEWDKLKVEYFNSEILKFKKVIDRVKEFTRDG